MADIFGPTSSHGQGHLVGGVSSAEDRDQLVLRVDPTTKRLLVDAIATVGHDITEIGHGVKTVTTAGTDVVLANSTTCKKLDIQAQTDNTGLIAVGASGVDATVATGTGIILNPGDVYSLEIDNLADIYIDATVSGDGVRYTYYT